MPTSVKFREAYARGVPLVTYDRFSPGASAYRAAAAAFLGAGVAAEGQGGYAAVAPLRRADAAGFDALVRGGGDDERTSRGDSRAPRAGPAWSGRR